MHCQWYMLFEMHAQLVKPFERTLAFRFDEFGQPRAIAWHRCYTVLYDKIMLEILE